MSCIAVVHASNRHNCLSIIQRKCTYDTFVFWGCPILRSQSTVYNYSRLQSQPTKTIQTYLISIVVIVEQHCGDVVHRPMDLFVVGVRDVREQSVHHTAHVCKRHLLWYRDRSTAQRTRAASCHRLKNRARRWWCYGRRQKRCSTVGLPLGGGGGSQNQGRLKHSRCWGRDCSSLCVH